MGIMINCGGVFSEYLGIVHPSQGGGSEPDEPENPFKSLDSIDDIIIGEIVNNTAQCSVVLNPADTDEPDVRWEIVSGNATISQDGLLSWTKSGNVTIKATSVIDSGIFLSKEFSLTFVGGFVDFFGDANAKAKFVSLYDKDGDGEVSLEEATATTISINTGNSATIKNADNIESLECLQYFSKLTTCKFGTTGQITIKRVVLPSSVTSVGDSNNVVGSSSLHPFVESFFMNSVVASIPSYFLQYADNLNYVVAGASTIGGYAFAGGNKTLVKILEGTEILSGRSIFGTADVVDLPSTINKVSDQIFRSSTIGKVILRATTPPDASTLSWYLSSGVTKIYVPDESIDLYRNDPYWGTTSADRKAQYYGISELEES